MDRHLRLLGRPDCELCEIFEAELRAHPDFADMILDGCDVDASTEWQRRYGLRIPVLLDAWNDVICEARFDAAAFEAWCDERRRAR